MTPVSQPATPSTFAQQPVSQADFAFWARGLPHYEWLTPAQLGEEAGGSTPDYIIDAIQAGHVLGQLLPSTGHGGKEGEDKRGRYKIRRREAALFLARTGTYDADMLHDAIANSLSRLDPDHLRALLHQIQTILHPV